VSKIRLFVCLLLLSSLVLCAFGSNGVFATWEYNEALAGNIVLDIEFIVMPWEGAEELPSESETGNNHKNLITALLNGSYVTGDQTVNVGLNTEGSYIAEQIQERKSISWRDANQLGTMDVWQSDTLAEYFNLRDDANHVAFILEFPDGSPDTYYLYTTSYELGSGWSPNIPTGTNIFPVYRTTLKLGDDGKWSAVSTEVGYAKSALYKNPLTGLSLGPAFDTSSWTAGRLGTEFSNAVYSKADYTIPVETMNSEQVTYYKFDSTSNTNRTVTVANSDTATVSVYDSNGNLVSASQGAQGSQSIRFGARRNQTYYIAVTGDTFCTFTIS